MSDHHPPLPLWLGRVTLFCYWLFATFQFHRGCRLTAPVAPACLQTSLGAYIGGIPAFQFEDFPLVFEVMRVPGGAIAAGVLAAVFPLLEVASLPFLFSLRVPAWLRKVSMVAGVSVGALWLLITLWATITQGSGIVSGIFGATLAVSSGWWGVVFAALLLWSAILTAKELPVRRLK